MHAPVFLGVDGGGTRTRALLVAADGAVLGAGEAGSSNVNAAGFDAAVGALLEATRAAWASAGIGARAVDAAFLGISGAANPATARRIERAITEAGAVASGRCGVASDIEAALAGGIPGRPGMALIAGTGTFCLGRDGTGKLARCGGWGWLVDDEGGGAGLGRAALRAVFLAGDGRGAPTGLSSLVLAHAGVGGVLDLVPWIYGRPAQGPACAALAPLVTRAAAEGDAVALGLLRDGAGALAGLVRRVVEQLVWSGSPELILVGGLARSGAPYQPLVEEALRTAVPGLRIVEPVLTPVAGAALLAMEAGGIGIGEKILARLRAAGAATMPGSLLRCDAVGPAC
jgi:N-acetylglucosamine kinase-like BadF-type ATPase